jgi:hypothetical protein
MKREPITDIRAEVQDFVRFLRETGEGSLETKNLPERETLKRAVDKLGHSVNEVVNVIERSVSHEHAREHALHSLWGALYSAYAIGSYGTVSENTEVYVKAVGTAAGRTAAAEKHAPDELRIQKAIAEAEKAGGRGWKKAIARDLRVNAKTVSRYLKKKKRTA